MKKVLLIACVIASAFALADDFVDDVYYSTTTALNEQLNRADITPYYNKKNMVPLEFIMDTIHNEVLPNPVSDQKINQTDSIAH